MGELLSVILHGYSRSHGVFILPLAGLILARSGGRGLRSAISSPLLVATALGLAGLLLATYGLIVLQRLFTVVYSDHLEGLVASISWLVMQGRAGYPDWHDGDLYGGIYGPLLFWINGAALLISPTIFATKLAAAAALLIGLLALWRLAGRAVSGWPIRLLLAALLIDQLLPYRLTAFWIRSEPYLYLFAAFAILAGARMRPVYATLAIGLLAGLAVDLKIHALLYMLPIGLFVLARARDSREGAVLITGAALIALVAIAVPTLADPSTLLLYGRYLGLAAGHGISATAIAENAAIAAALAAMPLVISLWRRPVLARDERWFLSGLAVATLMVIVLGSKIGALPNYLLPLAPSYFYLTIRALTAPCRRAGPPSAQLGLAATIFLMVLACNAGSWLLMLQAVPPLSVYNAAMTEKRAEFIALIAAHPDAETGIGDDASYEDSYFSPLQVIRNGLLHIAVPAWMDLREGGIDEAYARRFLDGCAVQAWILPSGAPFSLTTPYTGQPLFSEGFRADFASHYGIADRGRFYSVWTCRTGNPDRPRL